MLSDCTLCTNKEDPRWGLMTKEGDYYPLCDGCAPDPLDKEDCRRVADACRAMGRHSATARSSGATGRTSDERPVGVEPVGVGRRVSAHEGE